MHNEKSLRPLNGFSDDGAVSTMKTRDVSFMKSHQILMGLALYKLCTPFIIRSRLERITTFQRYLIYRRNSLKQAYDRHFDVLNHKPLQTY